jgi:DNA-binding response OmpR family regulator
MDAGTLSSVTPEIGGVDGGGEAPAYSDVPTREAALLHALRTSGRRVVTRRELARAAGLREHPRRVDVHLVNVRRLLADEELVNVRGRGWMLVPSAALSGPREIS